MSGEEGEDHYREGESRADCTEQSGPPILFGRS